MVRGRLTVLDDERNLILGRDLSEVMQKGQVYEIIEFDGAITLKPIGDSAIPEKGYGSKYSDAGDVIQNGMHILTKEEQKNLT